METRETQTTNEDQIEREREGEKERSLKEEETSRSMQVINGIEKSRQRGSEWIQERERLILKGERKREREKNEGRRKKDTHASEGGTRGIVFFGGDTKLRGREIREKMTTPHLVFVVDVLGVHDLLKVSFLFSSKRRPLQVTR